jgi:hypothetical protein
MRYGNLSENWGGVEVDLHYYIIIIIFFVLKRELIKNSIQPGWNLTGLVYLWDRIMIIHNFWTL